MNAKPPLLQIRDLVIEGFQDGSWRRIVDGVSLDLRRGEVLGLIGESGAGKSTIGLSSMGYARHGCRVTGGSIIFDGLDLVMASAAERRLLRGSRLAYVAQSAAASFNPAHRLVDQCAESAVEHGIMTAGIARTRALDIFGHLDLPQPKILGQRYPHEVSGGQLQRVMLAMAMSCKPDLVVFDEPTTALDVTTQIEVLRVVKQAIAEFNLAALYITHDLAVVSQLAHRIMVLRHGRMVEIGETRQIIDQPREEYTSALLSVAKRRMVKAISPSADPPILRVEKVSAGYGSGAVQVLRDVSLDVKKGTTVSLVGESGSGKSTLARVIAGLLPQSEGRIRFGTDILAPSYRQRPLDLLRRIQIIYQLPDVALNPRHKVGDIVGRPVELYEGLKGRERLARASELLEMVELEPKFLDRFPAEISGGEKQRVCIARALAARPELIICDEITSALDQLVADGVLKLLQRLQTNLSLSLLFITHDFATVRVISDEVVVMRQGSVVEKGPRDAVMLAPRQAYTRELLASVPEMNPDWLASVLDRRLVKPAA